MIPFEDPMLSRLTSQERAELSPRLELSRYSGGHTILVRGELLCRLYILLDGGAVTRTKLRAGWVQATLNEGDFFGETAVTEERAVSDCSVRAGAHGAVIVSLPTEIFHALLEKNASLKRWFLQKAAERRQALGLALSGLSGFKLPTLEPPAAKGS